MKGGEVMSDIFINAMSSDSLDTRFSFLLESLVAKINSAMVDLLEVRSMIYVTSKEDPVVVSNIVKKYHDIATKDEVLVKDEGGAYTLLAGLLGVCLIMSKEVRKFHYDLLQPEFDQNVEDVSVG
jgi:hypothetical protein